MSDPNQPVNNMPAPQTPKPCEHPRTTRYLNNPEGEEHHRCVECGQVVP